MPRFSPPLILVICVFFCALSLFNIYLGRKRQRQEMARGFFTIWYKQPDILTGVEYLLIVCALLLNLGITTGLFPSTLAGAAIWLYLFTLLLAAIVLGTIIFWAIRRARATRPIRSIATPEAPETPTKPTQRTPRPQKSRNRQRSAASRRRRAGRV